MPQTNLAEGILGFPEGDYDKWPENIQWCFRWRIRNAMTPQELRSFVEKWWYWERLCPNAIKEIRKAL